jgi:uncharacterized OsmC-like protein
MTTATIKNGVDVGQLSQTIEHIKQQPELAQFKFRAHTEWEGGARSRTTIKSFYGAGHEDAAWDRTFGLAGDEPPVLLGQNTAPNAVETVLHALTSCLTVGFAYNAAARGIEIRSMDYDIEGKLDLRGFLGISAGVRPGYDAIKVTYRVDADAPREDLEALCEYVQATSPVMDMLRNETPIEVDLAD